MPGTPTPPLSPASALPAHDAPDRRAVAAAQTRAELLDAGVRILSRDPARHVFGHLKATVVAQEAGRTTGAFFHHWATQEHYVDELIAHLFEHVPSESQAMMQARMAEAISGAVSIPDAVVESCRAVVDIVPREAQTVVELLLWACAARDLRLTDLARAGYDARDPQGDELFDGFLQLIGRAARPPFTVRSMGVLLSSLGQIIALRSAITEEAMPEDTLGWIVLGLLPLLTTADGDARTAAEVAHEMAAAAMSVR